MSSGMKEELSEIVAFGGERLENSDFSYIIQSNISN